MKTPRGILDVYDSAEIVANAMADLFVERAGEAIGDRGEFSVALAGGTTPKEIFALLAGKPRVEQIDWKDVAIYFGDERCVPPADGQSNYKMAYETLLRNVPVPAENVFRMRGEEDPEEAAKEYAEILRRTLGTPPRFDLVMLGMGTDAHTASLFPGADPHEREDELVRAVKVDAEGMYPYRITITPKVINSARCVAICTTGKSKADALKAVMSDAPDATKRPIQSVAPTDGKLFWLVDRAAASALLQKQP